MNDIDLTQEISRLYEAVTSALAKLPKRGKAFSEANRKYHMALREEILKERAAGTPVSIVNEISRGSEEVSRLCAERD
jgi:uncharacterized protein with von Willebrand factor type A (vWA) domain